jgi:hypothetical protein
LIPTREKVYLSEFHFSLIREAVSLFILYVTRNILNIPLLRIVVKDKREILVKSWSL